MCYDIHKWILNRNVVTYLCCYFETCKVNYGACKNHNFQIKSEFNSNKYFDRE